MKLCGSTGPPIKDIKRSSGPARDEMLETPRLNLPPAFMEKPQLLMNRGLLHLAAGDFEIAKAFFTSSLTCEPNSLVAVNNLAIANLYTGYVEQAISFLESSTVETPSEAGVDECLIFNLATM
jgi:Tfp pilus assembly protein PilF